MKYKLFLGIIIPMVIIIILSFLGSIKVGINVEKNFKNEILLKDFFEGESFLKNSMELGKMTISNNYFLPQTYTMKPLMVCLVGEGGSKQSILAGSLGQREGNFYSKHSRDEIKFNLGVNEKKEIIFFLEPSRIFSGRSYEVLLEEYSDYNKLVIYEKNLRQRKDLFFISEYYYDDCQNIESFQKEIAVIKLTP